MSRIFYAIEIVLSADQTPADYAAIGLKDSAFRFITDRPGYTGNPCTGTIPTWGVAENLSAHNPCIPTPVAGTWYEGFLTKEAITGNPSRAIDISMGGNYGNESGLSFSIRSDVYLISYCQTNNIYLINQRVNFYVVIDDVFYQAWSGVITNNPEDELTVQFVCQDDSLIVHKNIPPAIISAAAYPNSTNQGDAVPVCFGDVPYAELKNTKNLIIDEVGGQPSNSITLNADSAGNSFKRTAALIYQDGTGVGENIGIYSLGIMTRNVSFAKNQLQGYYLAAIGDNDIYKITGNNATNVGPLGTTVIYISEKLPYKTSDFNNQQVYRSTGSPNYTPIGPQTTTLWFEIFEMSVSYRYSQVEDYPSGASGATIAFNKNYPKLLEYTEQKKQYDSDGNFINISSQKSYSEIGDVVDISASGGLDFLTNPVTIDGKIKNYIANEFDILRWMYWQTDTASFWPDTTLPLNLPFNHNFRDYDRRTGYWPTTSPNFKHYIMAFDIAVDISKIEDSDSLFVALDINVNSTVDIRVGFQAIDIFKQVISIPNAASLTPVMGSSSFASSILGGSINLTPNEYYDIHQGSSGNEILSTSASSSTISTGNHTITVGLNLHLSYARWVRVAFDSTNCMIGTVISYDDFTGVLVFNSIYTVGSGTHSAWTLYDYAVSLFGDVSTGTTLISDTLKMPPEIFTSLKINPSFRVWFYVTTDSANTQFNLNLHELSVFSVKSIDTIKGNIYAQVDGEKVGYYPDGTSNPNSSVINPCTGLPYITTPTNDVYHAFMHLLEDYDRLKDAGGPGVEYDNIGTTRAALAGWYCGRQLTDQQNSVQYLIELAKQSFVGIFTNRLGKKQLTSWLDKSTPEFAFTQNNIVADSIQNWQLSDVTSLFNELAVKYAWNPGANKFDKTFLVANVDQAAFPAFDTPTGLWTTYCSGPSYNKSKEAWTACRTAYLKNRTVQKADTSLTDCYWYQDGTVFSYLAPETAWIYFLLLINWITQQKETVDFYVPISAVNIVFDLLSFGSFADTHFTLGQTVLGWLYKIEIDARNDQILFSFIGNPDNVLNQNVMIEQGSTLNGSNVMIETGTPASDGNIMIEGA
jgi:hypothetical protein